MPPDKILKYLLDIESIILEIEMVKKITENNFDNFQKNFLITRAVERQLEIIGEALNKIKQLDSSLQINNSKNIISLRNLIVHAYDSIDIEILWGIIQKDIPILKSDIEKIKNN